MNTDYKRSPFKKRPVLYCESDDVPEDLSVKRTEEIRIKLLPSKCFSSPKDTNETAKGSSAFPSRISLSSSSPSLLSSLTSSSTQKAEKLRFSEVKFNLCKIVKEHLENLTNYSKISYENCILSYNLQNSYNCPIKDCIYPIQMNYLHLNDGNKSSTLLPSFNKKHLINQNVKSSNFQLYQCEHCKKPYSTVIGLRNHQEFYCSSNGNSIAKHQVKKNLTCKSCEKVYATLGALKMHIRTHTLPYKCLIYGKAFSRPWLLQGHIRTHTGEKPFTCGHCGRAFADRSNLRAHQQTHVEVKKYICANCEKSYSRVYLLNKHQNGGCHSRSCSFV